MSTRYSVSEGFSLLKCLVFPLLLLSLITTVNATSACYFPNGARSPDDSPCYTDDDGVASHCCSSTSICLTNKLCLSMEQPYELSRGSCTDADWNSGSCPLGLCGKFHVHDILTYAHSAQRRPSQALASPLCYSMGLALPPHIVATLFLPMQQLARICAATSTDLHNPASRSPKARLSPGPRLYQI